MSETPSTHWTDKWLDPQTLFQIVVMIGAVFGFYSAFNTRISNIESDTRMHAQEIVNLKDQIRDTHDDTAQGMKAINDKLDRLVERDMDRGRR